MGAHFEALNEPVLMAPSDSRYTQVVFNLISVQVCPARVDGFGLLKFVASYRASFQGLTFELYLTHLEALLE